MCLNAFKSDCINLNHDEVVQKYLLDGSSFFFNNVESEDEFTFKKEIAQSLNVNIREVVIVGSGKLGFSIKPDEHEKSFFPFKEFDFDYKVDPENNKSDLDIAIVSNELFDKQLLKLYEFTSQYINREVWNEVQHKKSLALYVLKGWLRPDFTPKNYRLTDNMHEVLHKYKMKYGRDVNIGVYKSWYYFERYHYNNIRNINLTLIANG